MPVGDELLIASEIRRIDPFAYLDLALYRRGTFVNLEEIPKGVVLIEPPQGKDPADTRTYGVDGAPLVMKKGACIFCFCHPQVRKDYAVCNVQFQTGAKQFFEGFVKSRAETVGVEGV